jgi:hypothetical protein
VWTASYWTAYYWATTYWPPGAGEALALVAAPGTFTLTGQHVITRVGIVQPPDWLETEIGRWVRDMNTQFDGHPTLARWKDEAEAAAQAGPPYPWFPSELQRLFLAYFISVQ